MSTGPSGVGLARQVMIAAREAAKGNGGTQAKRPKRRTSIVVWRDGHEPLGLGAAIGMMMTERGMVVPAAGDGVLAAAVPELAGHVKALKFDTDTSRLDAASVGPAHGTQLCWVARQLVAAVNKEVRGGHVRTVQVLAPTPAKAGPTATAAAVPVPVSAPAVPTERRTPPEGYRRAIEAHRQAARPPRADRAAAKAVERQTATINEGFPELLSPYQHTHTVRERYWTTQHLLVAAYIDHLTSECCGTPRVDHFRA